MIPLVTRSFSLRHPPYNLSTVLHRSSEQPFRFTMHYCRHRESTCITVNVTHSSTTSTYEELKVKYYYPRCHKKLSFRHPCHDLSATLRSLSEQPFDFTMHYTGHRESTYVLVHVTHSSTTSIESEGNEKDCILAQE